MSNQILSEVSKDENLKLLESATAGRHFTYYDRQPLKTKLRKPNGTIMYMSDMQYNNCFHDFVDWFRMNPQEYNKTPFDPASSGTNEMKFNINSIPPKRLLKGFTLFIKLLNTNTVSGQSITHTSLISSIQTIELSQETVSVVKISPETLWLYNSIKYSNERKTDAISDSLSLTRNGYDIDSTQNVIDAGASVSFIELISNLISRVPNRWTLNITWKQGYLIAPNSVNTDYTKIQIADNQCYLVANLVVPEEDTYKDIISKPLYDFRYTGFAESRSFDILGTTLAGNALAKVTVSSIDRNITAFIVGLRETLTAANRLKFVSFIPLE